MLCNIVRRKDRFSANLDSSYCTYGREGVLPQYLMYPQRAGSYIVLDITYLGSSYYW